MREAVVLTVQLRMKVVPNTETFGHWLSKENTLEMKNFGTHLHLVFIPLNISAASKWTLNLDKNNNKPKQKPTLRRRDSQLPEKVDNGRALVFS